MSEHKRSLSLQDIFFFIFLILLSWVFYQMLQPFLVDLFLTLVLVIMFRGVHHFIEQRSRLSAGGSAGLTILIVIVVLLIPLGFVSTMVTKEVAHNYELVKTEWPKIEAEFESGRIDSLLTNNKYLKAVSSRVDTNKLGEKVGELVTEITRSFFDIAQSTLLSITNVAFHLLMIVFFMYFMLVDGRALRSRLQFLIPMDDNDEAAVMRKLTQVTEGIVFNTFLAGLVEGTWGGILLAIAGVPSPFFWGTMMVALSIIPLVGANSVLFPAGVILLSIGHVWQGLLVLILGTGLILINQNFIKPKLDGKRSGMHPAIVVIASLGGMFWMGLVGFIAGPFLAAAFIVLWDQFGKKFERQLTRLNAGQSSTEHEDETS